MLFIFFQFNYTMWTIRHTIATLNTYYRFFLLRIPMNGINDTGLFTESASDAFCRVQFHLTLWPSMTVRALTVTTEVHSYVREPVRST